MSTPTHTDHLPTRSRLLSFCADTFIHVGCGQAYGAIDLPFAREAATSYPYIAGSSVKGALRQYAEEQGMKEDDLDKLFGPRSQGDTMHAGAMLVGDIRLLFLPVRSLTSNYKWVTCPHILKRLYQDILRTDTHALPKESLKNIEPTYKIIDANCAANNEKLFLEELSFYKASDLSENLCKLFAELLPTLCEQQIAQRLVIVPDDDFHWFANNALHIQARNELTNNKTSNNLWYEESLPPDTVMYMLLSNRYQATHQSTGNQASAGDKTAVDTMIGKLQAHSHLQIGGNETVGMGWLRYLCAQQAAVQDEGAFTQEQAGAQDG